MRLYLEDVAARTSWVVCPGCNLEWNALTGNGLCLSCVEKAEKDANHERELGAYLLKTIGPYGIERYGFHGWIMTPENSYAYQRFFTFKPEKDNLFLFGPGGTGKTHLAGALLKAVCGLNLTVKWTNPIWLSRQLRARYASEEEAFIEDLVSRQVLIVDDLGVGKDTNATLAMLYETVDRRRHRNQNGLVITSNLSLDELAHSYKDDRIASRIAGMCEVIQILGADRRAAVA